MITAGPTHPSSRREPGWLAACAPLLVFALACGTSERLADAGLDADGGRVDEGDMGDRPPPSLVGENPGFGEACEDDGDCQGGLFCDPELEAEIAARDLPGDAEQVPIDLFPGGLCTPMPATALDSTGASSCNPFNGQPAQGCGRDGTCVVLGIGGLNVAACRPLCEPDDDVSGCARLGYTCDWNTRACVEGCQSDAECRLRGIDVDGDGEEDALGYDAQSEAICSQETFRCELPRFNRARTGEACERLDDCEANGECIGAAEARGGFPFPGGFCSKSGCDVEDRECVGDDAVCEPLRPWLPGIATPTLCLTRCTVGAEAPADQVGTDGHGDGCREGYRCHYNGGPGAESGVCVGGSYNDVAASNLGQACVDDAECFSPFGLGACLTLSVAGLSGPTGVCSLLDCAAPGLPEDVCGERGECVGLNRDLSHCAQTCERPEDCAEGYACVDDDLDASTRRICFPACFEASDCAANARCDIDPTVGAGTCVATAP